MRMIIMVLKKLIILAITALFFQTVFAEILQGKNKSWVTELDSQNIAKCQEQLYATASDDFYPVIMLYASNEPFSNLFVPTFEKVANQLHSKRAFFKYDAGNANPSVTSQCLGLSGAIAVPTVMVAYKFIEDEVLTNPLRANLGTKWDPINQKAVSITPSELIELITLPFPYNQKIFPGKLIFSKSK